MEAVTPGIHQSIVLTRGYKYLLPLELPYTLTAAGTLSAIITGSVNNTLTHRQSTLHQSYTTHNQIKAT